MKIQFREVFLLKNSFSKRGSRGFYAQFMSNMVASLLVDDVIVHILSKSNKIYIGKINQNILGDWRFKKNNN